MKQLRIIIFSFEARYILLNILENFWIVFIIDMGHLFEDF